MALESLSRHKPSNPASVSIHLPHTLTVTKGVSQVASENFANEIANGRLCMVCLSSKDWTSQLTPKTIVQINTDRSYMGSLTLFKTKEAISFGKRRVCF